MGHRLVLPPAPPALTDRDRRPLDRSPHGGGLLLLAAVTLIALLAAVMRLSLSGS